MIWLVVRIVVAILIYIVITQHAGVVEVQSLELFTVSAARSALVSFQICWFRRSVSGEHRAPSAVQYAGFASSGSGEHIAP